MGRQPEAEHHCAGKVTVLVVDDHPETRDLVCTVAAGIDSFAVVGEAASGEEALEATAALSPRLVIMDRRMPGIDGLEATRLLKARHPEVVVVLMSADELPPHTVAEAGAASFINKHRLSRGRLLEVWQSHAM